jgi:hypothetical protein
MLYRVGRFLQFAGLVIMPLGIAAEVAGRMELKHSLMVAGAGGVIFFLGWLLQQSGKPS